uniref:XPG N-terminal domain-containing protein n=1 Tax=Clastoptera arizonana TaxID=38151 RepID=A0A1B6EGL3_9HEMI
MGVHGLWKLLEPAGKPVPVETLENKVLAVDVSIWLHQLVKGFQDSSGSSLPNAHLLGLYHRVCKLLFFKIKPVFVFDGGVPVLKRKTMEARKNQKTKAQQTSEKVREQLLKNILKQKAVSQVLEEIRGEKTSPKKQADMFELPPLEEENSEEDIAEISSGSSEEDKKPMRYKDLHSIDVNSVEFKSLPADMRYDILTELKETRKQNSWGRVHEMPEELSDFSSFQMKRLLTRRSVQVSLEEVEKEMGGRTLSLGDVEKMLKEGGVDVSANFGQRIASDSTTRFLYVNKQDENIVADPNKELKDNMNVNVTNSNSEIDYNKTDMFYVDSDSSSDILIENVKTAKKLVAEHNDLTQEQILELIKEQGSAKSFVQNLDAPSTSKQSEMFCNEYTIKKEPTEEEKKVSKKKKSKLVVNSNVSCDTDLKMEIKKEDIDYRKNDNSVSRILNSDTDKVMIDSKSNKSLSKIRADILKSLDEQLKELSSVSPIKIEVNIPTARVDDKTKSNESIKISSLDSSKTDEIKHNPEKVSEQDKDDLENNLKTSVTDKCLTDEIKQTLEFPTNKPLASEHNKTVQENKADFSGSSSDSSDLVDVQSCSSSVTEEPSEQPNLPSFQIEFKTTETCENDIFADVFNKNELTDFEVKENDEVSTSSHNTLFENNKLFDNFLKSDNVNITEVKKSVNSECLTLDNKCLTIDPGENITITSPYFEEKEQGIVIKTNVDQTIKPPCNEKQENINEDSQKQNHSKEMISKKPKLTQNELLELKNELEVQEDSLKAKKGKEERTGATITEQMYIEAQELLHLFGVPYVIAPMEAEAQCAFLDSVGLTEGTITDDSDIWLFGGRQVYKNFFNQTKFVLQFKSDDIQHFFKLARAQLVLVALLVGSDYTVGLQGIGPVTALEILASFPPPSNFDGSNTAELLVSLEKFKEWMKSPPPTTLGKKLKDVQLLPGKVFNISQLL